MAFRLTSSAFRDGDRIPRRHTCDGPDLSPPLEWHDPPDGTRAFALACEDPDAPRGTWIHWVLYDLPQDRRSLPEGVPADPVLPALGNAKQGRNDFGRIGYGGPCPPPGKPHRYVFILYALDRPLGLAPGIRRQDLARACEGRVLAEARLTGTYARER